MNLECQFEVTQTGQAADLLRGQTNLPKSRIKDAMTKGAVWLTNEHGTSRLRRASRTIDAGNKLAIYYNEKILGSIPPQPKLIADKSSYSVWYKPPGLMSSGSRFGDHHTIGRLVEQNLQRPVYPVHRLDRFTRGIMLLTHNKQAARHFAAQFKNRQTYKEYQAKVVGNLQDQVTIDTPLEGKQAISHITPLRAGEEQSLVKVVIDTGRKHQIRQHLAGIGHPVLGDTLYGMGTPPDLQLAAVALAVECYETGETVTFSLAETPLDSELVS